MTPNMAEARREDDPAGPQSQCDELTPKSTGHVGHTPTGGMLAAALELAGRGFHVLPCHETGPKAKAPYTAHGLTEATTEPDTIRAWWGRWPHALIALLDGHRPDTDL